jgi:hypothetical protein
VPPATQRESAWRVSARKITSQQKVKMIAFQDVIFLNTGTKRRIPAKIATRAVLSAMDLKKMIVSHASKRMESQQLQKESVITNAPKVLSLRCTQSQIEAINATLAKKIAILVLVLLSA